MASLLWRLHSFNSPGNAQVLLPGMGRTLVPGSMVLPRKLSCPTLYSLSMTGPGRQSNAWGSQDQNAASSSSNGFAYDFQ